MTHGSLFAGIGGFDLGFERAGIRTLWAVEKEPFCQAVLKTHFPETEIFDDVSTCGRHNLSPVDVVSAGFPCQDFSVAGKRAGLAGNRSGLFHELARILGELKPSWFVLENVPGLFSSSDGGDFRRVLLSLDELGYGVAWRVLDSQHFGVAQRRRRVFIAGCLGKPCPAEVLFDSESGAGDSAESGETWQDVAVPLTAGIGITGNPQGRRREDDVNLAVTGPLEGGAYGTGRRDEDDPNLAYCLREDPGGIGQGHKTTFAVTGPLNTRNGHNINAEDAAGSHIVVEQAISSKWSKGTSGPAGDEHHNLVSSTLGGRNRGDDIDRVGAFVGATPNADRVRDFAGLPQGLDSARYRALGNAVTVSVAEWIGRRIVSYEKR